MLPVTALGHHVTSEYSDSALSKTRRACSPMVKTALTSKAHLFFLFRPGILKITMRHERWNVKDLENLSGSKQTNGLGLTFPAITRDVYSDSIFSLKKKKNVPNCSPKYKTDRQSQQSR